MSLTSKIAFSSNIDSLPKGIIVTEPNVMALWGDLIKKQSHPIFLLPRGEKAKSFKAIAPLIEEMNNALIDREGTLIAIGGGAVTDAAGFAASIYRRGIDTFYIPTTLLSMVDAAIGGKTALNFNGCKNLIGSYHLPKKILIAPFFLKSLPKRHLVAGFAEIVKIAAILDEKFFEHIETSLFDNLEKTIKRAIALKVQLTKNDPYDKDQRMLLNFGHTYGHALESFYKFKKFLHGEAVSIGMIKEAKWGVERGVTKKRDLHRLKTLLERVGLPTKSPVSFDQLYPFMQKDKKCKNKKISFVLIEKIGKASVKPLNEAPAKKQHRQT